MRSGVSRASVRSRLRCRMISCPAAKQMRWVNPSIATVSPSWTSSRTASAIEATLEGMAGMLAAFGHARDRLPEDPQPHRRLLLGDRERRGHPHDALARGEHEEPALEALLLDRIGGIGRVELD